MTILAIIGILCGIVVALIILMGLIVICKLVFVEFFAEIIDPIIEFFKDRKREKEWKRHEEEMIKRNYPS